jgi:uncharacterized protein YprB with RNaseH-like and TPR domain
VLRRTFQHVPTIGPQTEARLWRAGVTDWHDCLSRLEELPFGPSRKRLLLTFLERSIRAYEGGDAELFARWLPGRELWRLFGAFRQHVAFLDIETTGLGPRNDDITVIGLYDGNRARVFVRGLNLDEFAEAIASYRLVVTYNGAQFDLPFIRRALPEAGLPRAHLDLRFPLARLGYKGGLKGIERQLGIERDAGIAEMNGYDAVLLWQAHRRGEKGALSRLIRYNLADVIDLEYLATFVYNEMLSRLLQGHGHHADRFLLAGNEPSDFEEKVAEALREAGLIR